MTASHTVADQMSEHLKNYEQKFYSCVDEAKKTYTGDFYIVVLQKREGILEKKIAQSRPIDGVLKRYFVARQSCPTPNYDQTVYKYHRDDDRVEFLWTIPDRSMSWFIKENYLSLDPEYQQLVKFIFAFDDGSLLQLAKTLNGEHESTEPQH